jgi:hypothetical protein
LVLDGSGGFYGTTYLGNEEAGIVFDLVPSGGSYSLNILHTFTGGTSDGGEPNASLVINFNDDDLYGVTSLGGTNNIGTFYKIVP